MDDVIRIGKREIRPLFDLVAWEAIEEAHGDLSTLLKRLDSEDTGTRRRATLEAALVLVNNRIEADAERAAKLGAPMTEEKRQPLTAREIARGIPSRRVPEVRMTVIRAITEGMRRDYDEADEEPVDVVLEEIAKKEHLDG
jgi:hypothetical protein